jgi:hypothetical protein
VYGAQLARYEALREKDALLGMNTKVERTWFDRAVWARCTPTGAPSAENPTLVRAVLIGPRILLSASPHDQLSRQHPTRGAESGESAELPPR